MGRVRVVVTPRGGRDEVMGFERDSDGRAVIRVRVGAPPVDGRANEAVTRVLAKALGVAPSTVRVLSGSTARRKLLEVDGLDDTDLVERLSSKGER
ncbi:MAG: DUF167 family protein [Dehalococcoidia bacterium]